MRLYPAPYRRDIRDILKQCGVTKPPVDLCQLVGYLGLGYTEYFSPYEFEALILPYKKEVWAVVNSNQPETHRRFTLAHHISTCDTNFTHSSVKAKRDFPFRNRPLNITRNMHRKLMRTFSPRNSSFLATCYGGISEGASPRTK